jgi:hypothetical protein
MFYNPAETAPEKYMESYTAIREWIYNSSLDMYRVSDNFFLAVDELA